NYALDHPRHLIGTASGSGGNDHFDRTAWLPGCRRRGKQDYCPGPCERRRGGGTRETVHVTFLPSSALVGLRPTIACAAIGAPRKNVRMRPDPLTSISPRSSSRKRPSRRRARAWLTWIFPACPCDSMRLAMFTVLPQTSYENFLRPMTPAMAGP